MAQPKKNTVSQKEIIDVAEQKRLNDARMADIPWKRWDVTSARGNGAQSVRITARMATHGTISLTTSRDLRHSTGAKTASQGFQREKALAK